MQALIKKCPIPLDEMVNNFGLFIDRREMSRIIFMHEIYKMILPVTGVIMEFGCRWGQNMSLFTAFRGMYEPFNYSRRIIGFDTFSGFTEPSDKDGASKKGDLPVVEGYENYLFQVLSRHEIKNPINDVRKFDILKGDASQRIKDYLTAMPQTIISLAYFDMDIYEPTKNVLKEIEPYLVKGSILVFDELNHLGYPGETIALREVMGLRNLKVQRFPFCTFPSFVIVE
jgi:hypothetical protein